MRTALLAAALIATAAPAGAQIDPGALSQLGAKGGLGGLGGLLSGAGGAGVGKAGLGNVAGLLGYCLKNELLGATGAAAGGAASGGGAAGLLGKLTGKPGVTQSQGFLAGQQGVLSTGGANLPLGSLGDTVKQQLCRAVLSRARGLAGR